MIRKFLVVILLFSIIFPYSVLAEGIDQTSSSTGTDVLTETGTTTTSETNSNLVEIVSVKVDPAVTRIYSKSCFTFTANTVSVDYCAQTVSDGIYISGSGAILTNTDSSFHTSDDVFLDFLRTSEGQEFYNANLKDKLALNGDGLVLNTAYETFVLGQSEYSDFQNFNYKVQLRDILDSSNLDAEFVSNEILIEGDTEKFVFDESGEVTNVASQLTHTNSELFRNDPTEKYHNIPVVLFVNNPGHATIRISQIDFKENESRNFVFGDSKSLVSPSSGNYIPVEINEFNLDNLVQTDELLDYIEPVLPQNKIDTFLTQGRTVGIESNNQDRAEYQKVYEVYGVLGEFENEEESTIGYYSAAQILGFLTEKDIDNESIEVDNLWLQATNAYFEADYELALQLFNQVLELNPTHKLANIYKTRVELQKPVEEEPTEDNQILALLRAYVSDSITEDQVPVILGGALGLIFTFIVAIILLRRVFRKKDKIDKMPAPTQSDIPTNQTPKVPTQSVDFEKFNKNMSGKMGSSNPVVPNAPVVPHVDQTTPDLVHSEGQEPHKPMELNVNQDLGDGNKIFGTADQPTTAEYSSTVDQPETADNGRPADQQEIGVSQQETDYQQVGKSQVPNSNNQINEQVQNSVDQHIGSTTDQQIAADTIRPAVTTNVTDFPPRPVPVKEVMEATTNYKIVEDDDQSQTDKNQIPNPKNQTADQPTTLENSSTVDQPEVAENSSPAGQSITANSQAPNSNNQTSEETPNIKIQVEEQDNEEMKNEERIMNNDQQVVQSDNGDRTPESGDQINNITTSQSTNEMTDDQPTTADNSRPVDQPDNNQQIIQPESGNRSQEVSSPAGQSITANSQAPNSKTQIHEQAPTNNGQVEEQDNEEMKNEERIMNNDQQVVQSDNGDRTPESGDQINNITTSQSTNEMTDDQPTTAGISSSADQPETADNGRPADQQEIGVSQKETADQPTTAGISSPADQPTTANNNRPAVTTNVTDDIQIDKMPTSQDAEVVDAINVLTPVDQTENEMKNEEIIMNNDKQVVQQESGVSQKETADQPTTAEDNSTADQPITADNRRPADQQKDPAAERKKARRKRWKERRKQRKQQQNKGQDTSDKKQDGLNDATPVSDLPEWLQPVE